MPSLRWLSVPLVAAFLACAGPSAAVTLHDVEGEVWEHGLLPGAQAPFDLVLRWACGSAPEAHAADHAVEVAAPAFLHFEGPHSVGFGGPVACPGPALEERFTWSVSAAADAEPGEWVTRWTLRPTQQGPLPPGSERSMVAVLRVLEAAPAAPQEEVPEARDAPAVPPLAALAVPVLLAFAAVRRRIP
ncbi:MAG TPA: hypothetical protein VFH47_07970 [Candidatus Thermoplasmatota archaeon]|nr:hypothetical protein [Candidatus Thermoplasmatota archaeon]